MSQNKDTLLMNRPYEQSTQETGETRQLYRDSLTGPVSAEKPLLKIRPSWWNYFWHLFFCWLIVPLIVALWKRAGLLFTVFPDKVVLERGVLSKRVTQVLIPDIRSIDTRQNLGQRMVNTGDILVGTAAMAGYEIIAGGLPDPRGIANVIMQQRQLLRGNKY